MNDSFEEQFDNVQVELQIEQPYCGKQIREEFEDYQGFYDPVGEYMEDICSRSSGLCVYSKEHDFLHNLLPLCPLVLFFYQAGGKMLSIGLFA